MSNRVTRCKFRVTSVTPVEGVPDAVKVKAEAIYGEAPEDRDFSRWTPWGVLECQIDNPRVVPNFLPGGIVAVGQTFYLDVVAPTGAA